MSGFFETMWRVALDWPIGTIIIAILAVCLIFIFVLFLWLFISFLDTWKIPTERKSGKIVKKSYTPSSHYYSSSPTYYTPESFDLLIEVLSEYAWVSVKYEYYEKVKIGDHCQIDCGRGRLTNKFLVQEIY